MTYLVFACLIAGVYHNKLSYNEGKRYHTRKQICSINYHSENVAYIVFNRWKVIFDQ